MFDVEKGNWESLGRKRRCTKYIVKPGTFAKRFGNNNEYKS